MDTKLKNTNSNDIEIKKAKKINLYSLKFKIIIILLICIFSVISYNSNIFVKNKKSVYEGYGIDEEFTKYCYMTVEAKLNLQNEEHIREVYQKKHKLNSDYTLQEGETTTTQTIESSTMISTEIENIEENIEESTEVLTQVSDEIKDIKEEIENIVAKRTRDLDSINYDLDKIVNFVYVIKNNRGDIIDTNIEKNPNIKVYKNKYQYLNEVVDDPVKILSKQSRYIFFRDNSSIGDFKLLYNPTSYPYIRDTINLLVALDMQNGFELYFAVVEPITENPINNYKDTFFEQQQNQYASTKVYTLARIINIMSFVLMLILIIVLLRLTGHDEKYGEIKLYYVDKIPLEINILFTIIINLFISNFFYSQYEFILVFVITILILSCLCSILRCFKSKMLFKKSIIFYVFFKLKEFIYNIKYIFESNYKTHSVIFLSILGFLTVLNGSCYLFILLFTMDYNIGILVIPIILMVVALDFIFIMWLINCFASLKKIVQATKEISEGNIEYYIDSSDFTKTMKLLTENIAKIQNGLNEAVKKAVQDERLKTELITNVSHDLKTPLTSIINYIDLLKKEDLNSDKAYEYLNVLDEKAYRLKQLIEDLIEASKASSGSISVLLEKLDLHQLIMQSYGEYENRLSKNNLDVHIESSENQILICADGKHMWRIIANLLSNVSKYALPNSRVYINLSKEDNYALVSIKNISAYQLNVSATHLTERFVRGDSSRTTEGSGLGLSIAQSLTELQGGKFEIFIDGDLFKVNIKMPLWT